MGFLFFKSNFTLIAENTTKYYLELQSRYENRFTDNTSLLGTAGALDAQNYIFVEHSIEIDTIIDMAKKALSREGKELNEYKKAKVRATMSSLDDFVNYLSKEDELEQNPLFNFVFNLEVAIFSIDSPYFSNYDIELACFKKANAISNAIQKTMEKYVSGGRFASVTSAFMKSPEFQQVRKELGIKA